MRFFSYLRLLIPMAPREKSPNMGESKNERCEGTPFFDLGKGWVPVDYLVMVKCLTPNGELRYREMASPTLHPVEALGMLTTMADTMRARLMQSSRPMAGEGDPWDE